MILVVLISTEKGKGFEAMFLFLLKNRSKWQLFKLFLRRLLFLSGVAELNSKSF